MKKDICLNKITSNEIIYCIGYNDYRIASSYKSLLDLITYDRQISEYIHPDRPTNIFFDVEFSYTTNEERQSCDTSMEHTIDMIISKLNNIVGELYKIKIGVARSNGTNKISSHIIVRLIDSEERLAVFSNMSNLKNFILTNFSDLAIDKQVYRLKGGLFRCLKQSKPKDVERNRVFSLDTKRSSKSFDLLDFFVQHVGTKYTFHNLQDNKLSKEMTNFKNFYKLPDIGTYSFCRSTVLDLSLQTLGTEPDEVLISDNTIPPVYKATGLAARCPVHARKHKSNRSGLTLNENNIYCFCYDDDKTVSSYNAETKKLLGEAHYNMLFNHAQSEQKMLEMCRSVDPGVISLTPVNGGFEALITNMLSPEIYPLSERNSEVIYHRISPGSHVIINKATGLTQNIKNVFIEELNQKITINNNVFNIHNEYHQIKTKKNTNDTLYHQLGNINALLREWLELNNPIDLVKFLSNESFFDHLVYDDTDSFYMYNNGYWSNVSNAYLKSTLMHNISDFLTSRIKSIENLSASDIKRLCEKVSHLMTRTSFSSLFDAIKAPLMNSDFANKLNRKRELLGFTNGVYDLDKGLFRECDKSDMLSVNTGYSYDSSVDTKLAHAILSSIFPCQIECDYVVVLLARMLNPSTANDSLIFFTGSGSNGKSILFALIKAALGPLSYDAPSNIFSNKETSSNAAQPQLLALKNKRVALLSEPSIKMFNSGTVKRLCGNEFIAARALFSNSLERITASAHFIVATNEIPDFTTQDEAIWRRIVIVSFNQKFVSNPTEPNEQRADPKLLDLIRSDVRYSQSFLNLLISRINDPLPNTPNAFVIAKAIEECASKSISDWLDENIISEEAYVLTMMELQAAYLDSMAIKDDSKISKQTFKAQVRVYVSKKFPDACFKVFRDGDGKLKRGWKGLKIKY